MRQQTRLLPPRILLHRRQAQQTGKHHHQQGAASTAEDHAKKTIGAGQAGHPHQFGHRVEVQTKDGVKRNVRVRYAKKSGKDL